MGIIDLINGKGRFNHIKRGNSGDVLSTSKRASNSQVDLLNAGRSKSLTPIHYGEISKVNAIALLKELDYNRLVVFLALFEPSVLPP